MTRIVDLDVDLKSDLQLFFFCFEYVFCGLSLLFWQYLADESLAILYASEKNLNKIMLIRLVRGILYATYICLKLIERGV